MSKKIIVSLVGDQTIPNVLFIKEKGEADIYYFITTDVMETRNRVDQIVRGAGISDKVIIKVPVIEDALFDIEQKLNNEFVAEDEDEILVNVSGGTKIMSIATYTYFIRSGGAEIFYLPIGKNEIRQIFPLKKNRLTPLHYRVTLAQYLQANGVTITEKTLRSKNNLLKAQEDTVTLFHEFTSSLNHGLRDAIFKLRSKGKRGKLVNKENSTDFIETYQAFLLAGFKPEREHELNKHETKYLTGDWFEEYVYSLIKHNLGKSDNEIGLGVQLSRNDSPNELDIIFTHNNALYVIECKTNIADNEEGKISKIFTDTLYKAAALKKDFGLWVNYYLFALNDFSALPEAHMNRAKTLGIQLIGTEVLSSEETSSRFFDKLKK